MNNKYKPKFYARTQPKLAYVKKREDIPPAGLSKMSAIDIEQLVFERLVMKFKAGRAATMLFISDTLKGEGANWSPIDEPGETV